jgi:hypothetical protein
VKHEPPSASKRGGAPAAGEAHKEPAARGGRSLTLLHEPCGKHPKLAIATLLAPFVVGLMLRVIDRLTGWPWGGG